ncbi:MAG: NUDIX hydrolase [Desulfobacterales bacterium]|nr:NUDIX hydrolase [Desulfobacterales bacterium]
MNSQKNVMPAARVHETREVYRGKCFSFKVEDVTLPNGERSEYAMVRHPGSTAVVPVLDDGRVVMTRQYRHVIGEYILEIPAGTMEPGEPPAECARRELEEETGMAAGTLTELARIHILPSYSDELIHVYLARDLTPTQQNLDRDEIIQVEKHPMGDLMQMIDDARITDALTILSLQKAMWRHH